VPAGVHFVQIGAWMTQDYTCSVCQVFILKNDSSYVAQSYGATANTSFGAARFNAFAPVVPVVAGDYFTVTAYQNRGAAVSVPVQFSLVALEQRTVSAIGTSPVARRSRLSGPFVDSNGTALTNHTPEVNRRWRVDSHWRLATPTVQSGAASIGTGWGIQWPRWRRMSRWAWTITSAAVQAWAGSQNYRHETISCW
jgi:hypothetical protein